MPSIAIMASQYQYSCVQVGTWPFDNCDIRYTYIPDSPTTRARKRRNVEPRTFCLDKPGCVLVGCVSLSYATAGPSERAGMLVVGIQQGVQFGLKSYCTDTVSPPPSTWGYGLLEAAIKNSPRSFGKN
ncbi:hypothetical protein TWF569_005600 [Orbilia oligospora]|nr:hypothetical protein TWF706_005912 [Orbilia oligospora]KAF3156620.1 hypothetical protein TWF569_005600 [Orbilia oligospora]